MLILLYILLRGYDRMVDCIQGLRTDSDDPKDISVLGAGEKASVIDACPSSSSLTSGPEESCLWPQSTQE